MGDAADILLAHGAAAHMIVIISAPDTAFMS